MTDARRSGERRLLHAGPITVTFEDGALRWLRFGDVEVLRGVYVAVRDHGWRTIAGVLGDVHIEEGGSSFEVSFTSRHAEGDIDFGWRGRIVGNERSALVFTMDGMAASTFAKNRIGFCVLHPMGVAGVPLRVVTPNETIRGAFPERISPHQPFTDVTEMHWPLTDASDAMLHLEGDLFEMEDHRNWTDASFKTFCTPLRYPFPVTVDEGTRIQQAVRLTITGSPPIRAPGTIGGHRASAAAGVSTIEVHEDVAGPFPLIGTSLAPGRENLEQPEIAALRALRPAVIRTVVELDRPGWSAALAHARDLARGIDARLEIEAVAGDDGSGLDELVAALTTDRPVTVDVFVFPTSSFATTALVASRLRDVAATAGVPVRIGGGSRANFAEFNRADLPIDLLNMVGYPMTPQVHAFDDASLLETIAAQAVTVEAARRISGALPLAIGPVTLLPRFNPYTGSRPPHGVENEADRMDPRQSTWFAAAWTIASLASVAAAGAASVSYHEATGPAGLLVDRRASSALDHEPGTPGTSPVYAALRDVAAAGAASAYRTTTPRDVVALALAHDEGQRMRLIVANLGDGPRTVHVQLPARVSGPVARTVAGSGRTDQVRSDRPIQAVLGPYEVMRFDVAWSTPSLGDHEHRV